MLGVAPSRSLFFYLLLSTPIVYFFGPLSSHFLKLLLLLLHLLLLGLAAALLVSLAQIKLLAHLVLRIMQRNKQLLNVDLFNKKLREIDLGWFTPNLTHSFFFSGGVLRLTFQGLRLCRRRLQFVSLGWRRGELWEFGGS